MEYIENIWNRAGEMAQLVKTCAIKSDNLSTKLKTHVAGES